MKPRLFSARAAVVLGFALLLAGALVVPALSFAVVGDRSTPEAAQTVGVTYDGTGTVDPATHPDEYYRVYLHAGKRFEVYTDDGTKGLDLDLFLSSAAATDKPIAYSAEYKSSDEYIAYDVIKSGWYFVDAWAYDGSDLPNFPTPSAAGAYHIGFWESPVPYKLTKYTVPASAKKKTWFTFSVQLTPTYIRTGKPVTFVLQQKVGSKWKHTLSVKVGGTKVSGGTTKFAAKAKLAKGTWRVQARFADTDHKTMSTAWKNVKVK